MPSRPSLIMGAEPSASGDELFARFGFAPARVHMADAHDSPANWGSRVLKLMLSQEDDRTPPHDAVDKAAEALRHLASATGSRIRWTRQSQ